METRDERPKSRISTTWHSPGFPDEYYELWGVPDGDNPSPFGKIQSREVEKGYKPPPLDARYGYVHPVRPAWFRKVEGKDSYIAGTGTKDRYICKGCYGVWSLDWQLPHLWAVSSRTRERALTLYKPLDTDQLSIANTMAQGRVTLAGWETLVDLVELPESIGFVRQPLRSLDRVVGNSLDRAKVAYRANVRQSKIRFQSKKAKRLDLMEAIFSSWLAVRYAITPLVLSTLDAAETAAGKMQGLYRVFVAKGGSTSEPQELRWEESAGLPTQWANIYSDGWVNARYYERKVSKCSVVIRYYPNAINPDVCELARWGLSPTMLPSAIYEGIPFSFMLDWVTNMNLWIAALQPKPEITILDVCRTDTSDCTLTVDPYRLVHGSGCGTNVDNASGFVQAKEMKRSLITSQMTPPSLHFRNGFKLIQAIDTTAIVATNLMTTLRPLAALFSKNRGASSWAGKVNLM